MGDFNLATGGCESLLSLCVSPVTLCDCWDPKLSAVKRMNWWTSSWWCIWVAACLTRFCLFLKSFTTFILILIVLWQKSQRITLTHEWIQTFTWEREEPAVHGPSYGLQLDHIHGLSYVHGGRHAAQGAAHKLGHLLHRKHLQQLIKDGWERVQKCSLRMKLGTEEVLMTRGERFI